MNPQPDNSSFIQILNQVIHHLLKMPNYLVEDEAGLTRITDLVRCLVTYSMNYLVNYCGICLWIIWWRRRLVRYRITDLPPNKQSGCVLLAPPTPPFPYFRAKTNKQKRNQATNWTTVVHFFSVFKSRPGKDMPMNMKCFRVMGAPVIWIIWQYNLVTDYFKMSMRLQYFQRPLCPKASGVKRRALYVWKHSFGRIQNIQIYWIYPTKIPCSQILSASVP